MRPVEHVLSEERRGGRFLGVVVPTIYLQHEGVTEVLETLEKSGANAVCVHPTVARIVQPGQGTRFPDLHVDGYRRVLERPLSGAAEIQLLSFSAHDPDARLYEAGTYSPIRGHAGEKLVRPNAVHEAIDEARARGMAVHLQASPLTLPGLRHEDAPVGVDGMTDAGPRVAEVACINNPAAQAYGLALVADILASYPGLDGVILDWAEYPAYQLHEIFTCFCDHCADEASSLGIPWDQVRSDVGRLWERLHSLRTDDLRVMRRTLESPSVLLELLAHAPGILDFLRFKAVSVSRFYEAVAAAVRSSVQPEVALSARGWAPPWNRASGFDYSKLAETCGVIAPKLFSFDYTALPRWYGEPLQRWNPALPEAELVETLLSVLDLADTPGRTQLRDFQIPSPNEPHPMDKGCYQRRIAELIDQVGGRAACRPIAHAYGPLVEWTRTLEVLRDSEVDGIWVQMYGYLGDEKLRVMRDTWR